MVFRLSWELKHAVPLYAAKFQAVFLYRTKSTLFRKLAAEKLKKLRIISSNKAHLSILDKNRRLSFHLIFCEIWTCHSVIRKHENTLYLHPDTSIILDGVIPINIYYNHSEQNRKKSLLAVHTSDQFISKGGVPIYSITIYKSQMKRTRRLNSHDSAEDL